MANEWTCARCSTENAERTLTCISCGMIQGAVVVPGSSPAPLAAASSAETDSQPAGEPVAPGTSSWSVGAQPSTGSASVPIWRRVPVGLLLFLVLIVGGGIVGFILNAGRSSTGEIDRAGDMMATDLRVGDCFDFQDAAADEITDVTAKPCTTEHKYELIFTGSMPSGSYPSEADFDAFVETSCLPAFAEYVGLQYDESVLDISWLVPLADAWSGGDRSVQCSAYDPGVDRLTGSLKGSKR